MTHTATLAAAFDRALRLVDGAITAGMETAAGEDATPQLDRLRTELRDAREESLEAGRVDAAWIGALVRDTAAWLPPDEIQLLGALGAIARWRAPDE